MSFPVVMMCPKCRQQVTFEHVSWAQFKKGKKPKRFRCPMTKTCGYEFDVVSK